MTEPWWQRRWQAELLSRHGGGLGEEARSGIQGDTEMDVPRAASVGQHFGGMEAPDLGILLLFLPGASPSAPRGFLCLV